MAAWIYGAAAALRRSLYERDKLKRTKLPFPVISVGNLSWGGTGKTPLVEYLCRRAGERGATPLVLTRGYCHDEIEQMKRQLPRALFGVGANRAEVALRMAAQAPIRLAVLDDGFQHFPVRRDLEIITLNALNPFGNGKLIPRGILREPLTLLDRAHVVVITHANLLEAKQLEGLRAQLSKAAPKALLVEALLEPLFFYRAKKRMRVMIDRLRNQRVTTFAGIGTPRSFQALLSHCGIKPVRNFEFPDHHAFTAGDFTEIKRVSESASVDEIITTEKDYCRSPKLIAEILNPLILATRLRISSGEDALISKLTAWIGGLPRENRPREDRPNDNRPRDNRPNGNRPRDNRPNGNRSRDNRPNGNRSRDNRPNGNRSRDNRPNENRTRENRPNENRPNENRSDENRPDENLPDENRPDVNLPDVNRPDENCSDENRPDENCPNETPS